MGRAASASKMDHQYRCCWYINTAEIEEIPGGFRPDVYGCRNFTSCGFSRRGAQGEAGKQRAVLRAAYSAAGLHQILQKKNTFW
jgi:hypothetical protein